MRIHAYGAPEFGKSISSLIARLINTGLAPVLLRCLDLWPALWAANMDGSHRIPAIQRWVPAVTPSAGRSPALVRYTPSLDPTEELLRRIPAMDLQREFPGLVPALGGLQRFSDIAQR